MGFSSGNAQVILHGASEQDWRLKKLIGNAENIENMLVRYPEQELWDFI